MVKAPHQGSSIGVSIVRDEDTIQLQKAVDRAMFQSLLIRDDWNNLDEAGRIGLGASVS
ncbi:MAG: hypothetical protein WKG07_32515 [Hymenobacter sp.]